MCFITGRDSGDWFQPRGGQILQPYWSWQGKTTLQIMIQCFLIIRQNCLSLSCSRLIWPQTAQQQLPVLCELNPGDYEWVIWVHCTHTISGLWSSASLCWSTRLSEVVSCLCHSVRWNAPPRSLINTWFIHLYGPGLLHLQVLLEDRQQTVHITEERLWDDSQRRVHHHPVWGQLWCSHDAVWLCPYQWPGEQRQRCRCW